MYAACFSIAGWAGPQLYIFSGETLMEITDKFNDVQDISCLAMMAQSMGAEDPGTIDRLDHYMGRYQNGNIQTKDLEDFDVKLSVGEMKCLKLFKGKDAMAQLVKEYPDAIVK